jgi:peptidoglycan/LPS O-acetylase OafA/YrhL
MKKYLAYTGRLAAATPESRNRVVDFWRALAILMVVCGHWLAVSIWVRPDGSTDLLNSLEWVPYAGWITWLVQVMPVFFLAGGYANVRALNKVSAGEQPPRDWITRRARRLFTPVVPLLLVWVGLILILRTFVTPEVMHAGAMAATMPIWFLAVYLSLTALAPLTHAWWRRMGPWTLLALAAAAIGVDVARFVFEVPGIGWVNFAFVWALVHQVGYWWADRDDRGGVPRWAGWPLAAGALAVLIAVTWAGLYPVAMVSIPGQGAANMTPPTFAIAILGMVQFGIIGGSRPAVRRLAARARAWHAIVAFAGVAMTVFLWHLTAAMLAAAAGLAAFDGAVFRVEPGTTLWWATRPLWFLTLGLLTLSLVAVFARFEWVVSNASPPAGLWVILVGVLLVVGSSAATALIGITTPEGRLDWRRWSIPVAAIVGAALLGALPARKKPRPESDPRR